MNTPLRDVCHGRWKSILPSVGIDPRHLTGRHGPCPICGGRDRFRFDDKEGRGTWICSQCGAGDGIELAMRINGWDFKDAADHLGSIADKAPRAQASRERDQQSLRDAMNRLWQSGKPLIYGDPVSRYLDNRSIALSEYPPALRFVERCRLQDGGGSYLPAMVAKVTAPDGRPTTIHRTYLSEDGRKASIDSPRRLMPGKIDKGCAIRLAPAGPMLGIAEGIETALSASIIWNVPCWAAVSARMLMGWEPPPESEEIIIFADNDESFAGQSAAFSLAAKLKHQGRIVRVEMPIDVGLDWNDTLRAERTDHQEANR